MTRKAKEAIVAVALASAGLPSIASARPITVRTYHPVFKRVAGADLSSGSDYIAIDLGPAAPGQVQLIDRSTKHSVTIAEPGCVPDAVGGGWLAMTCRASSAQTSYALYDILDSRIVPFTPGPALSAVGCGAGCQTIAGIGTDWIAMTTPCADMTKCVTSYRFQNLWTGAIMSDPTNRTTRIDLDSARLREPVCRPLAVPRDNVMVEGAFYPGWGSLTMDGTYGLAVGNEGVYLQRCGSLTRTFLTRTPASGYCPDGECPPTSNRSMVVWQDAAGRLGGIFLKGLRRFEIDVPASVDRLTRQFPAAAQDPYTLALAGDTLYFEDDTLGTMWTARMPSAPR